EHGGGIGLIKSTDGGTTWTFPSGPFASRFLRISVNPANANELVAGTDQGGFKSTDGGTTWASVISGSLGFTSDLVRDPSNAQTIYASTGFSFPAPPQVQKSTDGGTTWAPMSSGLPTSGVTFFALAISPSNPQTLYTSFEISIGAGRPIAHISK